MTTPSTRCLWIPRKDYCDRHHHIICVLCVSSIIFYVFIRIASLFIMCFRYYSFVLIQDPIQQHRFHHVFSIYSSYVLNQDRYVSVYELYFDRLSTLHLPVKFQFIHLSSIHLFPSVTFSSKIYFIIVSCD